MSGITAEEAATEFKLGDVVELRSGGPPMTVVGYDDDEPPRLCCSFFIGTELMTIGFVSGVLTMSPKQATG